MGGGPQVRGPGQAGAVRGRHMIPPVLDVLPNWPAAMGARSPAVHLLRTEQGAHVFVVDGSRLFDIDEGAFARLSAALDDEAVRAVLADLGVAAEVPSIDDTA